MSIVALTLSATKSYFSKLDTAEGDERTEFTLGAIDGFVTAHVFDKALEYKKDETNTLQAASLKMNEMDVEVVRFGLKDVRNLKDAAGNDIAYTTQNRSVLGRSYPVVSEDILRALPTALIRELAGQIRLLNVLTKDEGKN